MILNFDIPEKDAAAAIGIHPDTLKKKRLRGDIPEFIYVKFGYKLIRYCLPLLKDWQKNPNDIAAHARSAAALAASLPSNQPRKAGRKAA